MKETIPVGPSVAMGVGGCPVPFTQLKCSDVVQVGASIPVSNGEIMAFLCNYGTMLFEVLCELSILLIK